MAQQPFSLVWKIALFLFCLSTSIASARPVSTGIVYQYPSPDSREVPAITTIGIRAMGAYDQNTLSPGMAIIRGSVSGLHRFTYKVSRNKLTVILQPTVPFADGESVSVNFNAGLIGGTRVSDQFTFSVMKSKPLPMSIAQRAQYEFEGAAPTAAAADTVPVLPPMRVTVDDQPTKGIIYFTNYPFVPTAYGNYLLEMDQNGVLLKQKLLPGSHAFDFKIQDNGVRTYFDFLGNKYYAVDSSLNIIDSFEAVHGYITDGHELQVFKDGSYMVLAMSQTSEDMSKLVKGGFTSAVIDGGVIQIFDRDKNLTFEWRGIDHYNIVDAIHEDLTKTMIDFQHPNSLTTDPNGNIIMSNRHLSEITKISQTTGDIIWRLGGVHNQFNFLNDTNGISYQHAARLLSNGNLTAFDNGNFHANAVSRAVEYQLDEKAMTAKLVWQYHHTPETYGFAMGYVQRLESGNTLITWGADSITMTEVRPNGETAFEYHMGAGHFAYRAFKYEEPNPVHSGVDASGTSPTGMWQDLTDGTVHYSLASAANVTLELYDVTGKLCLSEPAGYLGQGEHSLSLGAHALPTGVYYATLRGDAVLARCKVMISHLR